MTTYYKPAFTASETIKNIKLPFNGLYNSFLGTMLDDEIERLTYDMSDDKSELVNDLIFNNLDNKGYNILLTDSYAIHLIEMINSEYDCNIVYNNIDYERMNLQNRGDNLYIDIDVLTLPSLQAIADKLDLSFDELFEQLQALSTNHFTSHSGFSSFYNPNISILKDVTNLTIWQDVYIGLIIELMTINLGCVYCEHYPINDIEQQIIESLQATGGSIELMYNVIDTKTADKLDDLLEG